jgi:cobalt/nickel transport system permease protein
VVVLTTVLIVQCFLFGDGGVTALGANVFDMALVGMVGGWVIYRAVSRCLPGLRGRVAAVTVAGAAGALVVFGLALLLSRALLPKPAGGDQ